jgi:hypothetical protein
MRDVNQECDPQSSNGTLQLPTESLAFLIISSNHSSIKGVFPNMGSAVTNYSHSLCPTPKKAVRTCVTGISSQ